MSRPAVLVTRPQAQAERFAARLAERLPEARAVLSPLLAIAPVALEAPMPDARGLIFTSENAVAAFAGQNDRRDLPVWCVGARTAAAALRAGFSRVRSAAAGGGDADALLEQLLRQRPSGPLLHLRGAHSRGDLADRLTAAGLPCSSVVVYDQPALSLTPPAVALLSGDSPVLLPLFSPRSARLFLDAAETVTAPLHPVAISPAVAGVWHAVRAEDVRIAARPDAEAMMDALVAAWNGIVA